MSYKTATQFHNKIKTFALYISDNQISMVTRILDEYEYQIIFLFSKLTNTNTNIRLKVKRNEFKCMIIYNMNIFNIIIILSISDKESFHFGTECTKYKELKVDFSCITFAFWAKIKQFLGIITANKAVNFSRYLGQLFE